MSSHRTARGGKVLPSGRSSHIFRGSDQFITRMSKTSGIPQGYLAPQFLDYGDAVDFYLRLKINIDELQSLSSKFLQLANDRSALQRSRYFEGLCVASTEAISELKSTDEPQTPMESTETPKTVESPKTSSPETQPDPDEPVIIPEIVESPMELPNETNEEVRPNLTTSSPKKPKKKKKKSKPSEKTETTSSCISPTTESTVKEPEQIEPSISPAQEPVEILPTEPLPEPMEPSPPTTESEPAEIDPPAKDTEPMETTPAESPVFPTKKLRFLIRGLQALVLV